MCCFRITDWYSILVGTVVVEGTTEALGERLLHAVSVVLEDSTQVGMEHVPGAIHGTHTI